jgi:hypothetical protein
LGEPVSTERRAFDLGIPTGRLWTVAMAREENAALLAGGAMD